MNDNPTATSVHREIDRLAWAIERDGIERAGGADIDGIVAHARTTSASPVLIDVLADGTQPANARTRAFGMVALQASRPAA
ncbi:MAG: hypothetical protein HKN44_15595 [Ilumatobacter sp.]|nr:hypothetical protein [Ilumatobacter sp.]